MLRKIDEIYDRFKQAWASFKDPARANREFGSGIKVGKIMAFAQVSQQLRRYDPKDFDSKHFKLGYSYAATQAQQVMKNDADNAVA